jgi:hypothetical protein
MQQGFETNTEVIKALDFCISGIQNFGIPSIPAGRKFNDVTWGPDLRVSGVKPLGLTNIDEVRIIRED